MIKCFECDETATFMVFGCCEYPRDAMCDEHAYAAVSEDWGRATSSCVPTEAEPMSEWLARKG